MERFPILAFIYGAMSMACFLLGIIVLLWAAFCYLGGPDARRGSMESIVWGTIFFAVAALLFNGGIYLAKETVRTWRCR